MTRQVENVIMFASFVIVCVLMMRAAFANWSLQSEYRKYADREKGLRWLLFPMVWVNNSYFEDKPELLQKKKLTEKRFLILVVAIALWFGLGFAMDALVRR